jgi:nicotinamidase/pyrazinamidase
VVKIEYRSPSILFWDVDTQADFMFPGGKLYVPGAETIVRNLKRLTAWAGQHKVPIVASVCAHHEDDPEFQQYPPHCLVGTPGQRKIPETLLPNRLVLPAKVLKPRQLWNHQQVIFEKQELDVFSNPNLESLLTQVDTGVDILLYGVVTEICVALTARGLLSRGFRVHIMRDAIAHLDLVVATRFFSEIRHKGGNLVRTEEVWQL